MLTRYSPYREIIKPTQFHDIGKLMFAFVMLFAYFSFSQWLIIWVGQSAGRNWLVPEPHSRRMGRDRADHHPVPLRAALRLLLSRERKRAGRRLIGIAIFLMFMRVVDIYWYVVPNFAHERGHFYFSIWYILRRSRWAACGWRMFFHNFRKRPLLPLYEPQIPNFLHQGSGHGH